MIFNCKNCNKEYKRKPSRMGVTKYCSVKCKNQNRFPVRTSFKKGHKTWNKGIPMSDDQKKKLSLLKRGVPNIKTRGENSGNWKGGISKDKNNYMRQSNKLRKEKLAGRKRSETCELCGAGGRICFDHDHKTGEFRGWLCVRCNVAIGMVREDTALLLKMSKYIIRFKK